MNFKDQKSEKIENLNHNTYKKKEKKISKNWLPNSYF